MLNFCLGRHGHISGTMASDTTDPEELNPFDPGNTQGVPDPGKPCVSSPDIDLEDDCYFPYVGQILLVIYGKLTLPSQLVSPICQQPRQHPKDNPDKNYTSEATHI